MFCIYCRAKLSDDSNFCQKCGSKVSVDHKKSDEKNNNKEKETINQKDIEMLDLLPDEQEQIIQKQKNQINKKNGVDNNEEKAIIIDTKNSIGGGEAIFKKTYLEYNKKRIFYKDIQGISYQPSSLYFSGIPMQQWYSYVVNTPSEKIVISFNSHFHIGEKTNKEAWLKLVEISQKLIEPYIVSSLIEKIFGRGELVTIGEIEFSQQGYSRIKTKLFGKGDRETIYWTDMTTIPKFISGMVVLWKNENGKVKQFSSIDTTIPNAVIIPELVRACYNRASLMKE